MRWFNRVRGCLVLAGAVALASAGSTRRVSVAQLEQVIGEAETAHRSETDLTRLIGALEMSERLTSKELDRLAARFPLKPQTALALQLLSDQSSFLDPPAGEQPADPPPPDDNQQRMLSAARAYAVETWGRLPNFFVTRSTTHFSDGAVVLHKGEWPVRSGLHPVGTAQRQVTFSGGKETLDTASQTGTGDATHGETGLRSWGEFGPALTVVLADMAGHPATFSHWEQTSSGIAAVYRYEVPRQSSHYAVTYCCVVSQHLAGRTQFGYGGHSRSTQQVANIPRSNDSDVFSETPAYHGTISIDPNSGAVMRLTIEADLSRSDPLLRAATMIEYGPVKIGDRSFVLPVRGLAISLEPGSASGCGGARPMTLSGVGDDTAWQSRLATCDNTPLLRINETSFSQYHRLGSTSRIVTDAAASGDSSPAGENSATDSNAAKQNAGQTSASSDPAQAGAPAAPAGSASAASGAPTEAAAAPASPPVAAPVPLAAPVQPGPPPEPEISMSEAGSLPNITPGNPASGNSGFSLRVTSRLVDVGVVVTDKKGVPVSNLPAEDFEVFDNGRKQEVRFFTSPSQPASAATPSASAFETPQTTFSNRASSDAGPAGAASKPDGSVTILLVDESHIAWADMNNARAQMIKFVKTLAPGLKVGLYSMNERGFKVLLEPTADHAQLAARLEKFTPSAQSVSQATEEEARNRRQINEVHNVADLNSVNGNNTSAPDADQPVDPQLLTMGSDPARASMIILSQVARHLSALAGHKSLVWVSSDNVFADWLDQSVGIDKSPREIATFALRVQEAMNDAHTSVYPFDVSQLEGNAITADMQHRNVELTPAAADNAATAAAASGSGPAPGGRNMQPGRIMAEMSQDLRPIQGSVRAVAEATGGRTIRRSGDLAAALKSIVDDGSATYRLSFSPEGQADDQYHVITVKISGHKGLTAHYRTGYIFSREATTLKERFSQAIWSPLDVSEIALKAEADPTGGGASIKLNIAAADLGMEQRADRWMDKLDIFYIQRDDAGLHARLEGQTLGLRLKPATYQNVLTGGVPFERAVAMQPGMGSLRILVVDENSGRMGSITLPASALKAAQ